jgi:hypothetical protein
MSRRRKALVRRIAEALNAWALSESIMRCLPAFLLASSAFFAVPALAQPAAPAPAPAPRLGARTASPEQMMAGMDQSSPEDEIRRLEAEADRHPLGTVANPVRVGGPDGERAYLARLRCADGTQLRIGTRREAGVGGFGSLVGAYEIACGATPMRIVFDMYQEEHVETRAPAGFTLAR